MTGRRKFGVHVMNNVTLIISGRVYDLQTEKLVKIYLLFRKFEILIDSVKMGFSPKLYMATKTISALQCGWYTCGLGLFVL